MGIQSKATATASPAVFKHVHYNDITSAGLSTQAPRPAVGFLSSMDSHFILHTYYQAARMRSEAW